MTPVPPMSLDCAWYYSFALFLFLLNWAEQQYKTRVVLFLEGSSHVYEISYNPFKGNLSK